MTLNVGKEKWISENPVLFGILMAFALAAMIVVVETWFPRLDALLGRHGALAQATSFSFAAVGWSVYILWRWHRRGLFWTLMTALFLMSILGLFLYSTHFGPIAGWQWTPVLFVEVFAILVGMDWTMRRFARR